MKSPKRINLSKYNTAAGAAKALYRKLREHAEYLGMDPDVVFIKRPEDRWEGCGGWFVCWEEGPYEWGIKVSMDYDCDKDPEYTMLPVCMSLDDRSHSWMAEPYWSFSLVFYSN